MRNFVMIAALMLASSSMAQVFEPVRIAKGEDKLKNTIVFQFSQYDYNVPGVSGKLGGLLVADFALGEQFGIGFWVAADRQSDGVFDYDLQWTEVHLDWYVMQQPTTTLALNAGALRVDDGFDYFEWSEFGLVGSTQLDPNAPEGSVWSLGYNLSRVVGSGGSLGSPADGWTYGLNVAYRFDERWSANASWYRLDLSSGGGGQISRTGIGVGFRF